MECHSSGKGKVPGSSGESSSVADTYVVTTGGRRIKLKGAIEDTWSHGTPWGANGWKCGYCPAGQKSGGKTHLTEHLCAISGNVKSCSHVPPNVKTILLDQVALARQKKRDVKQSRLYIEKALMEHDYRTTLASLDGDAQYDMAVQNSLMDIGSTPKNRASGSGIYRAASPSGSSGSPLFHKGSAPSTGLSNLGKASSSGTKSATLGKASSSGSGAAASTRQSSLHSFYQNPSSSKAPFDIDLARSKAPLQPRIDTMLSGDSALRLAKTWSKWFHANDVPGRKADCPYYIAAFRRKMQLGKKKKRKMQLDEDDECIADDYDTSSEEHGSPVYAESGDSSSNDEDDGDNDVGDGSGGTTAGTDVPGASGVNHGEPTPLRPRSTRKRKPNVKSIYIL